MNCDAAFKLMSAYIDQELDDEKVQAISTHITFCPGCRNELQTLQTSRKILQKLAPVTPPQRNPHEQCITGNRTPELSLPLEFHPVTPGRWSDLQSLFGEHGACGGCWCMWWRLKRSQWTEQKGEGNKRALERIVDTGEIPGILAYSGGQPFAWCSVAPREAFPALERSRTLKRLDDEPVWSIVCFFVAKPFRRKGVTVGLLRAAVEYVRSQGGKIIEGYPTRPDKRIADAWVYMGLTSAFVEAGFAEVARPSKTRSIMRYYL